MFILSRGMKFYAPFDGARSEAAKAAAEAKEQGTAVAAEADAKSKEEFADFNKQFSSKRQGVELPHGTPGADPEPKVEGEPPVVAPPVKKPAGSNVPKIVEDKRKAESERDEYKTRLEKYEKEEKPGLEKKVVDLEAKIAEGGHTLAERKELEYKLEAAESRLIEREKTLVNQNKELVSKLSYYDVQEDPDFKKQYVQPMIDSYGEAVESFQADPDKMQLLRKALIANSAALSSGKPEERLAQEKERNAVLSQLTDSLDEFSRGSFTAAMNAYIRATKQHAVALGKHSETQQTISKQREDNKRTERTKIFDTWTTHQKTVESAYDAEIALDGDVADAIKELKLDPDKDAAEFGKMLNKIITGRASMEESVDLLNRGRVYPRLVAKTKAQEHIISGLRATISKLRGAKPGGGAKDGAEHTEKQGEDKAEFNKRFSATRPGLRTS